MALRPNSPAIDAGIGAGSPVLDQRGVLRPQGLRGDIGAYELEFNTPLITGVRLQSASQFWLQAYGLPNRTYALQMSSNLTNWSDLIGLVTSSNGVCEIVDVASAITVLGSFG